MRQSLINELKKYFEIRELVCPHTFNAFGERSWQFLDGALLETILIVRRDILKVPMTVNTYHLPVSTTNKVVYTQRGIRCNLCQIVQDKTKLKQIYLSAHVNGAGIDFIPAGMTAEEARVLIKANESKLPTSIRLEKKVSWVHMDVYDYMNGKAVNEF